MKMLPTGSYAGYTHDWVSRIYIQSSEKKINVSLERKVGMGDQDFCRNICVEISFFAHLDVIESFTVDNYVTISAFTTFHGLIYPVEIVDLEALSQSVLMLPGLSGSFSIFRGGWSPGALTSLPGDLLPPFCFCINAF